MEQSTKLLEAAGCEVHHASADADRLILLTALAVADSDAVSVLVGYDTDLLVLLIVLSDPVKDVKMLMPGIKVTQIRYTVAQLLRGALGLMVPTWTCCSCMRLLGAKLHQLCIVKGRECHSGNSKIIRHSVQWCKSSMTSKPPATM